LTGVRELAALIASGKRQTLELALTPEAVNYVLDELNTGNRRLSETRARNFAETMGNSSWIISGEPIIFSHDGILNTGQHRLRAAQIYGKPVIFNVAFGVPREAFVITDTGRPHSSKDALHVMGIKQAPLIAATCRLIHLYKEGLPESDNKAVTNDTIVRVLEAYPDIEHAAIIMCHFKWPDKGFRSSILTALTWMSVRAHGEDRTRNFLEVVAEGLATERHDAARVLRERFLKDQQAKLKMGQTERFALAIKALNAWMEGRLISTLVWRLNEDYPTVKGLIL
jgi:hypothetical protein